MIKYWERLLQILALIIFCAPFAEALHADGLDCDELTCLVCHASSEETAASLILPCEFYPAPAHLGTSPYELILDKAPQLRLSTRGPPSYETDGLIS